MSKSHSRAKRKRRRRARAGTSAGRARPAAEGVAPPARKAGGAKARGDAPAAYEGRARARGDAPATKGGGAKARGGATDPLRRPDPIWAPFPLTEIGMGVGIAIFGAGYLTSSTWLVSVGALVLAVVVGELCLREHFAGFRSHALLLAALVVVAAHSLAFAISDAFRGPATLAVDVAVGGALAWWLRARFNAARERASATR